LPQICNRISKFAPVRDIANGVRTHHLVADEKDKPGFDEQTLGRLLEAAFVLQEHSEELRQIRAGLERKAKLPAKDQARSKSPVPESTNNPSTGDANYGSTLGRIIEIQRQIQTEQLNANTAMSLIAEQLTEICGAAGAAIGIVHESTVNYRAVSGIRTPPAGSSVAIEKALCSSCIRSGQVFSCPDVNPEILIDSQECKRRGIGSLVVVPVFHNGGIKGAVELYFSDARAFSSEDIHSCQLMAALVTEVLATKETSKAASHGLPAGTSSESSEPSSADLRSSVKQPAPEQITNEAEPAVASCYKCGHELLSEEQFCGECGAARGPELLAPNLQSKVASLWHMQEAEKKGTISKPPTQASPPESSAARVSNGTDKPETELVGLSKSTIDAANPHPVTESLGDSAKAFEASSEDSVETSTSAEAPNEEAIRTADWTSALSTKEFFEQIAAGNRQKALIRFWNTRRGDIYLAIAILLVVSVIGWGIRSNRVVKAKSAPTPAAAAARKQPPAPQVSLFDRMLISVGLAEPPEAPEYKGNPGTQVWEDVRTGLYYCPGSDMYGKTQRGKYTSQRDAQLDRFEPAYRRACE
jgi:putative methionine-R-sulfoxide reductase with GAF domain